MNYQWYPGHMTKAIRMMQENIKLVDIIIELTDARIPLSGRNPDIDELGKGKARLVLLNKTDMADPAVTKQWIEYFENKGVTVVDINSKQSKDIKTVKDKIVLACKDKIERDKKRGIKNRPIRAMVAGIPNVGKSTFINHLTGKSAAKTGNKPGVTKGKQWIMLGNNMQLLDTPGILWPKFEDQEVGLHLALIGSMNDENLDTGELAVELIKILNKDYESVITEKYAFSKSRVEEIIDKEGIPEGAAYLTAIAESRKCLLPGGKPDLQRAAGLIIDDFRNARLGRISIERP
ncbi:MAG: ribosome biogenesis GTPase YlqF [Butyrivibrio sp.]|nr:ribosome biogenesis GTPase YlqF [Butyrivibrio sp.]